MAKGSISKSVGLSRIRFVMVEAEIADGDIGQITQAIQNALRPAVPAVQRISALNGTKVIAHDVPEVETEREADDEVDAETPPVRSKPKGPRKAAATPNVLEIGLTTDPSLASYAQKTNPKSHAKRFLVVAAWFKEHREIDAISVDHVYTCYRALKWPTNINDFAQPLRDLKSGQFLTSPEKGLYAINHLGIAEVEKLKAGGE
jgi:hypothetical protein